MTSIGTVFKRVYGEALAPYGFVKIKGRQPYFVRLIGDEIVQVITYRSRASTRQNYKEFCVYCGVATVYRQRLSLEKSPLENVNWLETNAGLYAHEDLCGADINYRNQIYAFEYKADDEESMLAAVKYSFEITEQIMLPALNGVTDLRSCMEYIYKYNLPNHIYGVDDNFGNDKWVNFYNEGLLHLKTYTMSEYLERNNRYFNTWKEYLIYQMKMGLTGWTQEDFEKWCKSELETQQRQLDIFDKLLNDPEEHAKGMEELEKRKMNNIEALRTYGFEI